MSGAFRKFMAITEIPLPPGAIEGMLQGLNDPGAAADHHFQQAHMLGPTTAWVPDVAALRASPARIVVGIGEQSAGLFCDRTSRKLASALGIEPVLFPGGHVGFAEAPPEFAARLRAVLRQG